MSYPSKSAATDTRLPAVRMCCCPLTCHPQEGNPVALLLPPPVLLPPPPLPPQPPSDRLPPRRAEAKRQVEMAQLQRRAWTRERRQESALEGQLEGKTGRPPRPDP